MRSLTSRSLRTSGRIFAPACALAFAVGSAHCGLLGSPGEYGGAGGGGEVTDGGVDGSTSTDGTVQGDGTVVLPDGNVVPGSIGTIAVVAGERDPTSTDDNPAWSGDSWAGVLGPDGKVASWRIDQSPSFIGSFDTSIITDNRWFMVNSGFGISGGRAVTIQSTKWGPGIAGDWKGARVNPPGGLDEHTRVMFGPHVMFLGGTRTVPVDGGTNTFFVREVHSADVNTGASDLGPTTNSGIELGVARSRAGAIFTGDQVYVVGGRFSGPGGITAGVERSPITVAIGAIGAFVEQPALKTAGVEHKVFSPSLAFGEGYLFVAGGRTSLAGNPSDVVLSAKIDPATGNLGEWQTVTKLPAELRDFGFIAFKKRLYVIGGVTANAGARTRDVLSAPINADGTLGAWDNTNAKLPAARSDMVAAAY